ncbi:Methyltransf_29 domain-containing protein [Cephalotus follicularis]|uniref:Methyltransf_29 domain-containing protein n=1 Tax=Cephalotus follicularis TaxID=3775 RepID=A0A1Q3BW25_CEPFO|nr:Methyltransf_29 domain-containing protein [Cephalotus follicularis]
MPLGKSRSSKRSTSTSTSYASTITTIVFIALCVLGVWMLTSNSVMPPQTQITTRNANTAATTTDDTTVSSSSSINNEAHATKDTYKKDPPAFEDNPGDLPDDAIKSDEPKNNNDNKQEKAKDQDNSVVVEENPQDLQGKESGDEQEKQKESETQVSEESTLTQNQEVEETTQTQNTQEDSQRQNSNEEEQQQQGESSDHSQESQYEKQDYNQQEKEQKQQQNPAIQNPSLPEDRAETQQQQHQQQQQQLQEDLGSISNNESQQQQQQQKEEEQFQHSKSPQNPRAKHSTNPSEEQQHQQKHQRTKEEERSAESNPGVLMPGGESSGIPKESSESKKSWATQATQSANEKERRIDESNGNDSMFGYTWQLCNVTTGADYIPCLDNEKALRKLKTTRHYEHRERHCPEDPPTCLVPLPQGYKRSIQWPKSRDKIWYRNVPHTLLAEVKGHQNWVKVTGEFLTFPGGGTQFIHGALHYIDFLQQMRPDIKWGKHSRVVLDVGCGVASFGGYLFDRDVLTMSFAPKDEHEAQVQFALERGIPAISAVMGTQRLPFPSRVFDIVHCARCRVPWHLDGGVLLLELNRVLRPGGYFVWSATPVYQKLEEDVEIWKAMSKLTLSMCWELVSLKMDKINSAGAAIYRKPSSNDCYDKRKNKSPPMCKNNDDPNAAWHVPLQACMHRVPDAPAERGSRWPENWPRRLQAPPFWLNSSQMGIYGKPSPQDFSTDTDHWNRVVTKLYVSGLGFNWSNVRNVMDMRAVYGGFAAALKDFPVWVLNVVNINSPDTLPIIFERGLFGIYHDWCESFSTYPRTYDLLHADHLFSALKKRCKLVPVMAEVDRLVRPGGKLIVRDESTAIVEVQNLLKSMQWEVHLTFSKGEEGILSAQKGDWRPDAYAAA